MQIASGIDVLIGPDEVQQRVRELGAEVTRDYAGAEPVLIGVLKGSFIFMADLVRNIDLKVHCEFLGLSSYGDSTESSGVVNVTLDLSHPIQGRDVLVVEDIVDTGLTMRYLLNNLRTRMPRTLKVCALLHKPERQKIDVHIDYLGFKVPNRYVVGYGLDDAGRFRNLPFIGVLQGG
jgi:hypoxanthine phosphoribosyltransferase